MAPMLASVDHALRQKRRIARGIMSLDVEPERIEGSISISNATV
jgi:hypothetical protein